MTIDTMHLCVKCMPVGDLGKLEEPEDFDDVGLDLDQLSCRVRLVTGLRSLLINHRADNVDLVMHLLLNVGSHGFVRATGCLHFEGVLLL